MQFDLLTPEAVARREGRNVFGVKIIQFTHNRGETGQGCARIQMTHARGPSGRCTVVEGGQGRQGVGGTMDTVRSIDTSLLRSLMNTKQTRFRLVRGVFPLDVVFLHRRRRSVWCPSLCLSLSLPLCLSLGVEKKWRRGEFLTISSQLAPRKKIVERNLRTLGAFFSEKRCSSPRFPTGREFFVERGIPSRTTTRILYR